MNTIANNPRIFAGVYPAGIVYADRSREAHGDYKRLAFLDYATLTLDVEKDAPAELVPEIRKSAAEIQARKGEQLQVSACNQTVLLGSAIAEAVASAPPSLTEAQINHIRAIASEGRDATIKAIREVLKRRSGKPWSVTGGRGTAWGWITIEAPPGRRTWGHRQRHVWPEEWEAYDAGTPGCAMSPADRVELANLLGYDRPEHEQGRSVPSSSDYYRVALCRALHGHAGPFTAEQYWD